MSGGLMSGGRMSGGRMSGGRLSGGLMSAHQVLCTTRFCTQILFTCALIPRTAQLAHFCHVAPTDTIYSPLL